MTVEYKHFAAELGITVYKARRIGKYECRRLLTMDEISRKLVMSEPHNKAAKTPIPEKKSVAAMMALAEKVRD